MCIFGAIGSVTQALSAHKQEKKAEAARKKMMNIMRNNNQKPSEAVNETASSLANNAFKNRTIGSLRIPLSKTSQLTQTENSSGLGLNIPT